MKFQQAAQLAGLKFAFAVEQTVAPKRALARAVKLWTTLPDNRGRRRDLRPAAEQLPSATRRLQLGASHIVAEQWGDDDAPLVYLVHGWGGWRGQLGRFVEPLVQRGYRVVAADALSHGDSGPGLDHGSGRSNFPEMQRSLQRAVDHFGPPHAYIGHSLGCAISLLAAVDGAAAQRNAFVAPSVDNLVYVSKMRELLGFNERTQQAMLDWARERAGRELSSFNMEHLVRLADLPPTLLVHDTRDKEVEYEQAAELAKVAGEQMQLVTTEGLGHQRILADDQVVDRVIDFVAKT